MNTFDKLRTLLLVIMIMAVASCSTMEHEPDLLEEPKSQTPVIKYEDGHIYVWGIGRGFVHIGVYMRTVKELDNGLVYCDGPVGSCMPDVFIGGRAGSGNGNSLLNGLGQDEIQRVENEYSNPLTVAVGGQLQEVQEFFAAFSQYTPIPEQAIQDMADGKLTIKKFGDQYALVNIGATDPDDVPEYDWIDNQTNN